MNQPDVLLILAVALALLAVALVFLLVRMGRAGQSRAEADRLKEELSYRVEQLAGRSAEAQALVNQQLADTHRLIQERLTAQESALREQLTRQTTSMQGQTSILQKHMEGTQTTLSQVTEKIGMVHQASLRMVELGKDIESLQRLLKAPKTRGELGELGLETLLGDILPRDRVVYQYSYSDGRKVDAMIRLDRGLLPVDAKFPVEDYQRFLDAPEDEKDKARREFVKNVKRKIEEISKLYVRPGEGTLPLALMYLPAESLYYEAFVARGKGDEDLWRFAFEKSVLPLSPGTMSAYLKTVAMGLKAAAVERNARQVLELLSTLERDLGGLKAGHEVLGRHITNAHAKYDETTRSLQRFSDHLERAKELGTGEDSGEVLRSPPPDGAHDEPAGQ
jgi:DNA recombination protein RmuC